MAALQLAGLDDLQLFLEFELPACSERADAVLLGGRTDGGLTAVAIELKQWTTMEATTAIRTTVGAVPEHVPLTAQFRCGGSLDYLTWLEDLLFAEGRPALVPSYDIGLARDPEDLANWVAAHDGNGHTARIAAGFCWEWPKSSRFRPLNDDVVISWTDSDGRHRTWQRPWNARDERAVDDEIVVPRKEFWASDAGGRDQVGCIYTCQGLEYDYAGVILGDDFVRRDGRWVGVPARSEDPAMHEVKPAEYTRLAANIYYVLASRGTRGCRLYSTDAQTRQYLADVLSHRLPRRHDSAAGCAGQCADDRGGAARGSRPGC